MLFKNNYYGKNERHVCKYCKCLLLNVNTKLVLTIIELTSIEVSNYMYSQYVVV